MCLNPYHSNQQNMEENVENICEIYQEFVDETDANYIEDDDIDNEYKENILNDDNKTINSPKYVKQENDENKVKISVTIKLITNKIYQKEKSLKLQLKNEDILRHTLLESELEISTMNDKLIKSYSYIP